MTHPLDRYSSEELAAHVELGNQAREHIAAEAAVRIALATQTALLEFFDDDPRLGDLMKQKLAMVSADQPAGVVDVLRTAARAVVIRTGGDMPARFAAN